ncbi:putative DNA-binding domain-containing protein [Ramlibacter sp.]|uniref:HvfC/BufC family peptide modification chaperone n=1 Tax=Ramlibacter sp. TaxID=1917967 RepID=UPI003D0BF6F2
MTAITPSSQRVFADALLDPHAPCPDGLRVWNGSDPARRFAVYRNNVVASLIDGLAQTFPVVQELVGTEFFRAMAGLFVRAHPPRTRVLAHYGAAFPAFVDGFEPARSAPYLGGVARLEFARTESFHAQDAPPFDAAAARLALSSGERVADLRLVPRPSLRLVESAHAIVSIWAAHQGHGELADVDTSAAENALVTRPDLEVLVVPCDAATSAFVRAAQRGAVLAVCAADAARASADFDLTSTLGLLVAQGALSRVDLPEEG